MLFFTTEKIGPNLEKTPEGYLLCRNVPICRTGEQIYGPNETPIKTVAPDGLVHIMRHEAEVFSPATLESFAGKSAVNNHPEGAVTPENWKELTVGVVFDPRRGTGELNQLMLAELLITDPSTIEDILVHGKREVSCGYEAEYVETSPGYGYQKNIRGNHVAIVDQARCGAVCSIADQVVQGAKDMAKSIVDRIRCAFAAKDEKAFNEALGAIPAPALAALTKDELPAGGGMPEIHIHNAGEPSGAHHDRKWSDEKLEEKFKEHDEKFAAFEKKHGEDHKAVMDAIAEVSKKMEPKKEETDEAEAKEIEGNLREEAPAGTGDKLAAAKDSVLLSESFDATKVAAEIIAPGIHIPTFDAAAPKVKTFKDICGLRRKALQLGNNSPEVNAMIIAANGGRELTGDAALKMPCSAVRSLFFSVSAMKANANNAAAARDTNNNGAKTAGAGPRTLREINEAAEKLYARK